MIKFRLYFDKDKETLWLNEMAQKGYEMTRFAAGFYSFEKGEPGKYQYQIDISKGLFSVEQNYREFMEEQGIEIVCLWGPWVFLRKKNSGTAFELYSDNESKIEHYTKIRTMFKVLTVIEIVCFIFESVAAAEAQTLYSYLFVALLGLFVLAFVKITLRTNAIITKLKNETGEGENKISKVLIGALLMNAAVLLLKNIMPDVVFISLEAAAAALMVIGIVRTGRKPK